MSLSGNELFSRIWNLKTWKDQGRSDGVSRVSNAYGPTAKGGPPKRKFTLDIFEKNFPKAEKSQIFDVLLAGPWDPRYGSGKDWFSCDWLSRKLLRIGRVWSAGLASDERMKNEGWLSSAYVGCPIVLEGLEVCTEFSIILALEKVFFLIKLDEEGFSELVPNKWNHEKVAAPKFIRI